MTPDDMEGRLLADLTHYPLNPNGKVNRHPMHIREDLRALLLAYQERGRALKELMDGVKYTEDAEGRRSYALKVSFAAAYQQARATLKGKSHE